MADVILAQIPIDSHLTLEIHDCSRVLTGDRWQVILEARMEIALTPRLWQGDPAPRPSREEMASLLGDSQSFVQRRERTFVDAGEREALVAEFITGVETGLVPYLKHPAFVPRFLESQYRKARERSQWSQKSDT